MRWLRFWWGSGIDEEVDADLDGPESPVESPYTIYDQRMSEKAVITAALTGGTSTKADNPNLPTSPDEIAAAAKDAWEAGAAIVHLHLRDPDEAPTADLEIARRTVGLVEESCGAIIQLSTGVGLGVSFEDRAALVEVGAKMATLNVCSMSFGSGELSNPPEKVRRLAARMQEIGVKPELELYDSGHLDFALQLLEEGLLTEPLLLSVVIGVPGGAAALPANLINTVARLPEGSFWQAVGIGAANLPMTAIGLAIGGDARTGMEDTLTVGDGVPAESNTQLVERLVGVARSLEREPATVAEVEELLGLS
jgi:3-keto-5-aminohexanoate cleavage enzyme